MGKGMELPCSLRVCCSPHPCMCISTWKRSGWGFYGGSITQAWMMKSLAIHDGTLMPFPSQELGGKSKVPILQSHGWFPCQAALFLGSVQKYLINIIKDTFITLLI